MEEACVADLAPVLIVDDEEDVAASVAGVLRDAGYRVIVRKSVRGMFENIAQAIPSLIILDVWLGDANLDGLGALERLRQVFPNILVLMMSGHGSLEMAVEAMRKGAQDFIEKPFGSECLLMKIKLIFERLRLYNENCALRQGCSRDDLVGCSTSFRALQAAVQRVAASDGRVVITGDVGSGKTRAAWEVHRISRRSQHPFLLVQASELTQNLEPMMMGAMDGQGLWTRAQGGSLVIDEVTDLPLPAQKRLAQLLQEQVMRQTVSLSGLPARLMATSRLPLAEAVKKGIFLEELHDRLCVMPIHIAPLRQRRGDIPLLLDYFSVKMARAMGRPVRPYAEEALLALYNYGWPGNIREIQNVVERLAILTSEEPVGAPIALALLPQEIRSGLLVPFGPDMPILSLPIREARESFERYYIEAQMARFRGNISKTATFIGMDRSALHRKLKILQLASDEPELNGLRDVVGDRQPAIG